MSRKDYEDALAQWYDVMRFEEPQFEQARVASVNALENILRIDDLLDNCALDDSEVLEMIRGIMHE